MKKIELYYNPFLEQASVKIDGESYKTQDNRLGEFLIGKPMENWLKKTIISYQRWDGILPELMEFFNDDELQILFYGSESDYNHFKEYIKNQYRDIELKGFESNMYTLKWIEKWNQENVYQNLKNFLQNRKCFFLENQKQMLRLEYIEKELNSSEKINVSRLCKIRKELEQIMDNILIQCDNEKLEETWKNIRYEFETCFL